MSKMFQKFLGQNPKIEPIDVRSLLERSDTPALISQIETMKQFQEKRQHQFQHYVPPQQEQGVYYQSDFQPIQLMVQPIVQHIQPIQPMVQFQQYVQPTIQCQQMVQPMVEYQCQQPQPNIQKQRLQHTPTQVSNMLEQLNQVQYQNMTSNQKQVQIPDTIMSKPKKKGGFIAMILRKLPSEFFEEDQDNIIMSSNASSPHKQIDSPVASIPTPLEVSQ